MSKYDIVVCIGKYSPLHNEHMNNIIHATNVGRSVKILIGSSGASRSSRILWAFEERRDFILKSLPGYSLGEGKIEILPLLDCSYNDTKWAQDVKRLVAAPYGASVGIIGGALKDKSMSYLKYFPKWEVTRPKPLYDTINRLNSTKVRSLYFEGDTPYLKSVIPDYVYKYMEQFRKTSFYSRLKSEYDYIKRYKSSWGALPFEPVFMTVDSVLLQKDKILLVKRKNVPGKGLWALPGGFIDPNEELFEAGVRELKEETGIKVTSQMLKQGLISSKLFSKPDRSLRGRVFSYTFFIKLIHDDDFELPETFPADDAAEAKWVDISTFKNMRNDMFEDHYHIVEYFLDEFKNDWRIKS